MHRLLRVPLTRGSPRAQLVARNTIRRRAASSSATPETGAGAGAVTGGLIGGGAAVAVLAGWYHFSGTKSTVQAAKQAKAYADQATDSLKLKLDEKTPDSTDQAIQALHDAASKYAAFIPGGKGYVDSAFDDLHAIRQRHGSEVDKIVKEAYDELRDASKKGVSLDAATESWQVLTKHLERLASLAGDAADDILNNHPQLKEKVGGSADKLKELGERYGPEAKKEVDATWEEINQVVKQGLQADSIMRIWKLIQEKTQKVQQMGELAFEQGFEQIKPMLEKNPKVKQFVEENKETLKQGNVSEVVDKVRQSISTGDVQDLKQYVHQLSSGQLSQWLGMIPEGSQILSQLQKLRDVAEKRGGDAEKLAKDTVSELKQVLDKKVDEAEKLAEEGKKDVKS